MITTISNKLKTLLENLTGTNQPLVSVFDYHTEENVGFPYACYELVEFQGEYGDSCTNNRDYNFDIYVMQEITESGGRNEAKEIVYKCIEKIIEIIDGNFTLDDVAIRGVVPVSGNIVPAIINNGPAMVGTLRVSVRTNEFIL